MKKKFKMENLDCANCAAKMEAQIKKIPGVKDANMNFMTQKLTLDAEDGRFDEILAHGSDIETRLDGRFDEILAEAQKCCDKVDKGCRILIDN